MSVVTVIVNGVAREAAIDQDCSLLTLLRRDFGLTGAKEGCDDSECGACMVLLDGRPVNSCSYLAFQAGGRHVTTIEGVEGNDGLHPLQQSLLEAGGVQCGFCTPGIVMSALALLAETPSPSDDQVRHGLAGNLCRCTGYEQIIAGVLTYSRRNDGGPQS